MIAVIFDDSGTIQATFETTREASDIGSQLPDGWWLELRTGNGIKPRASRTTQKPTNGESAMGDPGMRKRA